MLLVVQYPLVDVRRFVRDDTRQLARPKTFVRRAGEPGDRIGGAPEDVWPAEGQFWMAKQTVRFPDRLDAQRLGPWDPSKFMGAFRRLFWNPEVLPRARYELGISNAPRGRYKDGSPFAPRPDFDASECVAIVHSLMHLPIRIASHGQALDRTLGSAARPLSRLVLEATTHWSADDVFRPEPWWLSAGRPACLVEYGRYETGQPPAGAVTVSDPGEAFELSYYGFRLGSRVLPVWLLKVDDPWAPDVRLIRLHVMRLHAELETFRAVLELLCDEQSQTRFRTSGPQSDALDAYLHKATGLLSKESYYGTSSQRLVEAAVSYRMAVAPRAQATLAPLVECAARVRPVLAPLIDAQHPTRVKLESTDDGYRYPDSAEL